MPVEQQDRSVSTSRPPRANLLSYLDLQRRALLFRPLSFAAAIFVAGIVLIASVLRGKLPPSWPFALGLALGLACVPALVAKAGFLRPRLDVAVWTLVTAALAAMLGIAVMTGGLEAPVLVTMPLVTVLISAVLPGRAAVWVGAGLLWEMGLLWVLGRTGHLIGPGLSPRDLDTLRVALIAGCLGMTTVTVYLTNRERGKLERLLDDDARHHYEESLRDPLTQIFNRRYFTGRLRAEVAFALRHGTDLGLLVIDVDHFKRVNEAHGHTTGDAALVMIVKELLRTVRVEDVVCRYGGEEFVVLLRGETLAGAHAAAERIRAGIGDTALLAGGVTLRMNVSVGCASIRSCTEIPDASAVFQSADRRLSVAKQRGRNQVVSTDIPSEHSRSA